MDELPVHFRRDSDGLLRVPGSPSSPPGGSPRRPGSMPGQFVGVSATAGPDAEFAVVGRHELFRLEPIEEFDAFGGDELGEPVDVPRLIDHGHVEVIHPHQMDGQSRYSRPGLQRLPRHDLHRQDVAKGCASRSRHDGKSRPGPRGTGGAAVCQSPGADRPAVCWFYNRAFCRLHPARE